MKKIINKPETFVKEMCRGIVQAHPSLELLPKYKVIKRKQLNPDKVSLISGGGSGHEPAHAGFVGKGMLDAAVCGDVFASPSQIQVYQAIKAVTGEKGTLLIIKNYSGDVMNFRNALYLAKEDGLDVDYITVGDDIAVNDSLYTVGRRGVAGTVLVHKVAGAAAEEGRSLEEVKAVAQKAADRVKSIGFALTSCTVPAKGTPTFRLEEGEMEYGVGIHGEPGIRREAVQAADVLAERMTDALLEELGLPEGEAAEIALLVNGFGGTPLQELYLFNDAVCKVLARRSVRIARIFVGNYMTSIDMAGASLSIMALDGELKTLLGAESEAPGFRMAAGEADAILLPEGEAEGPTQEGSHVVESPREWATVTGGRITWENVVYLVDRMSEVIIANEVPFCELDAHAGDGDFGMSVAKGFRQLKREWKDLVAEGGSGIGGFLEACSLIIMEHCGGASGPIWGSAFRAAGRKAGNTRSLDLQGLADLVQAAVEGIQLTGKRSFGRGAGVGDKTLMDALIPFADVLAQSAGAGESLETAFRKAAAAAVQGAEETKNIVARMGRAGTVGERSLGHPDAGAHALGVIFTDLVGNLEYK
ncbi:dihydroxyacetone kinase subunit DhaK [Anaerotalea alkaliphila]|uniref:phosphoenolpyruvate--glycerone phosphotransferase n=1 Tax=Anaerotalea alkaliphila TaxID=2662126 RepID=A0A7X5HUM3_9FIRM|nr:dihydroxyacetone kinase subunit DhaK [Anaerotalea alkaliphila]NDL67011.1 dihydroxyacetone kinase subunit DhaK [Anaerotalea alkaliphila]